MAFHTPESFEFWKSHRFGYSADVDRLLDSLESSVHVTTFISNIPPPPAPSRTMSSKELIRFQVLQSLRMQSEGVIRAEDFGAWYSQEMMESLVQKAVEKSELDFTTASSSPSSSSSSSSSTSSDKALSTFLDPTSFDAEIQSLLNDHISGSRDWIFEHIEEKINSNSHTSKPATYNVFVVEAGAGFGKSMVSAAGLNRWCRRQSEFSSCLHYFFKVDDIRRRTGENLVKTLVMQFVDHLSHCIQEEKGQLLNESRLDDMKAKVLGVAQDFKEVDGLIDILVDGLKACRNLASSGQTTSSIFPQWLIIDALDECPSRDISVVFKLVERISRIECGGLKVLVTTRPGAIPDGIRKHWHETQFNKTSSNKQLNAPPRVDDRTDSGFTDDPSQSSAPIWEVLTGLENSRFNEFDIQIYFESTLPDVSDRGVQVLLSKAQGCFLWAKLAVSIIRDLNQEKHVTYIAHTVLNKDLGQLYMTNFKNSLKMPSFYQEGIKELLSLVVVAATPLTFWELEYLWVSCWMRKQQEKRILPVMKGGGGGVDGAKWNDGIKLFSQCLLYAKSRLMVRTDSNGLVMAGHKSLRDLVGKNQLIRYIDCAAGHFQMVITSLELLDDLSRDLAGSLPLTFSTRPKSCNSLEISKQALTLYASRFWFLHAQAVYGQSRFSDQVSALEERIHSVFGSDKAIHWITILARQGRLDRARAGLSFLLSKSILPNICSGLEEVVDRFSDILLDYPMEIYTSVAVFCLNHYQQGLSHLFAGNRVLPTRYRPRILCGASSFWAAESESNAMTTKITKPTASFDVKTTQLVIVGNRSLEATSSAIHDTPPAAFEVWDVETDRLLNELVLPGPYQTRKFCSISYVVDSERFQVVAAIFEDDKSVLVWGAAAAGGGGGGVGGECMRIPLKSVPRDIQAVSSAKQKATFLVLLEDEIVWIRQDTNDPETRGTYHSVMASKVDMFQNLHNMAHVVIGNSIWVAVLAGQEGQLILLHGASGDSLRLMETKWDGVVDFSLGVRENHLQLGIITAGFFMSWTSTSNCVKVESSLAQKFASSSTMSLDSNRTIQVSEGIMVALCETDLVLVDFAKPATVHILASSVGQMTWYKKYLALFHYQDMNYILFATGIDEFTFDSVTLIDFQGTTITSLTNQSFSSLCVQDGRLVAVQSTKINSKQKVVLFSLEAWIFQYLAKQQNIESNILDDLEPANVCGMQFTKNGTLVLVYDGTTTVDAFQPETSSVKRILRRPDAAAIGNITDRCDLFVSNDGSRMVLSSSRCSQLAWWDITEPNSPRLICTVKEMISTGWQNCYPEPNLDHLVFQTAGNRGLPLRHIKFENLSSDQDDKDECPPSVVASVADNTGNDEDNDSDYYLPFEEEEVTIFFFFPSQSFPITRRFT
ncbi:hypothetical protein BDR26DRAFT_601720 [Obelidium mucronatum]|nr:hypothetical protein BDR26DRAFT_601720 [Obelidium mucronatum]